MATPSQEQRGTRRFALRLPLSVHGSAHPTTQPVAHTKDVSARGVFFYLDTPVGEGSKLDFTLTLPPEITLTDSIRVRCKGKVIRVEPNQPNGKVGIAAVIEEYEFLPE